MYVCVCVTVLYIRNTRIYYCRPGIIRTDIFRRAGYNEDELKKVFIG